MERQDRWEDKTRLVEDDDFSSKDQDTVFDMQADDPCEDHHFQVPGLSDEILDRIPMTDLNNILLGSGILIHFSRGIERRGFDNHDGLIMGLMVGVYPDKCREEDSHLP